MAQCIAELADGDRRFGRLPILQAGSLSNKREQ